MELYEQESARGIDCVISNVRDVYTLEEGRWGCVVDITFDDGETETVDYVADETDTMNTGKWVVARITNNMAGAILGDASAWEAAKKAREDAAFSAKSEDERKAILRARVAAKRYEVEVGGTAWNGLPIATDRDSRAIYSQLVQLVREGLRTDGALFKFGDGVFHSLANADVLPLAGAAAAHVQACFDHEAALLSQIEAGQTPDVESGWV